MLKRKTIKIKLNDGKFYVFSERNKIDNDYYAIQERLREFKIDFIQNKIKDKDNQLALLIAQMNRIYTTEEIAAYVASNKNEQRLACYNSFKIENKKISFEDFNNKLLSDDDVLNTARLIIELEKTEDSKKKKKALVN